MAETIANVKTSDRQEWEQKLLDKCVRIMTPERWDILYARNAHLKCNQRIKWEEYRISRGRQELNGTKQSTNHMATPYNLSAK